MGNIELKARLVKVTDVGTLVDEDGATAVDCEKYGMNYEAARPLMDALSDGVISSYEKVGKNGLNKIYGTEFVANVARERVKWLASYVSENRKVAEQTNYVWQLEHSELNDVKQVMPSLANIALDPEVSNNLRNRICTLIGKTGEGAIPLLTLFLQNDDENIRKAAVAGLGYVGVKAMPILMKLLTGSYGEKGHLLNWEAAAAIGRIGKAAVPALVVALKEGPINDELKLGFIMRGINEVYGPSIDWEPLIAGEEANELVTILVGLLDERRFGSYARELSVDALANISPSEAYADKLRPAFMNLLDRIAHTDSIFHGVVRVLGNTCRKDSGCFSKVAPALIGEVGTAFQGRCNIYDRVVIDALMNMCENAYREDVEWLVLGLVAKLKEYYATKDTNKEEPKEIGNYRLALATILNGSGESHGSDVIRMLLEASKWGPQVVIDALDSLAKLSISKMKQPSRPTPIAGTDITR